MFRPDERLQKLIDLASEIKAENIAVIRVKGMSDTCDYFLICDAPSSTRVRAIAENMLTEMKHIKDRPLHVDGLREAKWVVLDFADVIVHVFSKESRQFYDIEELWKEAPIYRLNEGTGDFDE